MIRRKKQRDIATEKMTEKQNEEKERERDRDKPTLEKKEFNEFNAITSYVD